MVHILCSYCSCNILLSICCSVSKPCLSDSLQPHGLQHSRLPCPSLSPRVCSNSCSLNRWCYPLFPSLLTSVFPSIRVFYNELAIHIRWSRYWSFSISPSNEHSGLISFRIDWSDLLALQGTLEPSPTPQFENIISLLLSLIYGPTLTSPHDYRKNYSFHYPHLCWQSHVSAF